MRNTASLFKYGIPFALAISAVVMLMTCPPPKPEACGTPHWQLTWGPTETYSDTTVYHSLYNGDVFGSTRRVIYQFTGASVRTTLDISADYTAGPARAGHEHGIQNKTWLMEWNWVGGGTPQPSNNGANMYCDWSAYTYAPDRWFCTDEAKGEVHCGAELTMRQWNDPVWVVFQDREDDDKACAVVVDDNNWGVGVGVSVSWPPLPSIGFTWSPTGSGDNRSDNGYLFSKYVNAGGQITVKHHAQALLDFLGAVVTVTGNDEHAEASGTFTFMPNL